jgi:hypothetical protein
MEITEKQIEFYISYFKLPEQIARRTLPIFKFRQVNKNEILIQPGDVCQNGFIIISGGLIMSHINEFNDTEKVVNFFLPSIQPFCTVWDSYFTGNKTQCKLYAFQDSIVGFVTKSDMEGKISSDPEVRNYYLQKLNETLVFENNLRIKLLTYTFKQFYEFLITEYPQIIRDVPMKYIAEFIGISREWLSKIKSNKPY